MNSEASFSFRCAGALPDVDPADGPSELEIQITQVRGLRAALEIRTQQLHELQVAFNREHTDLIEDRCKISSDCAQAEARLRELTLTTYQATGSKKPAKGVGIRVSTVMKYDEAAAKEWALKEGHIFLSLDRAGFEGWLKTMQKQGKELPVQVEEIEKPTATIARDL